MRNYAIEVEKRVAFIQSKLEDANAKGIVYANSGGKDCTLVSILCKKACDNVVGVTLPCQSKRNYEDDMTDALAAAKQFNIETVNVDLTDIKAAITKEIGKVQEISTAAEVNIAPRLRMITVYTIAQSMGYLVAGTGNRSETFMGYFTKFGDGGCDFNPIADLTVTEVFEFLRYLNAPESIINKAPSAGLYEGQTDEAELGISYKVIDEFLLTGKAPEEAKKKMLYANKITEHKRNMPAAYKG